MCGKCAAINCYKMASSSTLVEQYIRYFRMIDDNFDEDKGMVDVDLQISEDKTKCTLRVMAWSKELGYRWVDAARVPRDCVHIYEGNEQFPVGSPEWSIEDSRPKATKRKAEQDQVQVKRKRQAKP